MLNPGYLHGKVYILENVEAKRVKVGMTTDTVERRRIDFNQIWLGTVATCQICGGRRKVKRIKFLSFLPEHVVSGLDCPGGDSLPLEKDSSLAREHLEKLKSRHSDLSGDEAASNTKRIKTLEERIRRFESTPKRVGVWRISTIYSTENAEKIEFKTHTVLSEFLDTNMPFGEVFKCSVEQARSAIFSVLESEGLASSVRVETNTDS